ncbi:MAG TPA: hypothetical protein VJQ82_17850 [Terriglobales bacterium]|nr:hypothetical protein [Terriglobales bacterium]
MLPEPNFPVPPDEFIGRQVHLDTFADSLLSSASTGRMASFAILGDWGIGNSSLLLKLASTCSDSTPRMLPVTFSISKDISDYMRLAEALCDRVAERGKFTTDSAQLSDKEIALLRAIAASKDEFNPAPFAQQFHPQYFR